MSWAFPILQYVFKQPVFKFKFWEVGRTELVFREQAGGGYGGGGGADGGLDGHGGTIGSHDEGNDIGIMMVMMMVLVLLG